MSNLLQLQPDPRSYHGTQALVRSTMGVSPETGISGYNDRLHAGVQYCAPISVNMDTEEAQVYDLPPSTYVPAYIVAEGAGGTGGTVEIVLMDKEGADQNTPLAAGDVSAGGQWTALDVLIDPQTEAHSIRVTPSNGGTATGVATLMLQMLPIITGWK